MGLEVAGDIITMTPGPIDVHAHPRAFDPLPDGKAGLEAYTEVMLESGITVMLAMPNESRRQINDKTGQIEQVQYPISNPDRGARNFATEVDLVPRPGLSFFVKHP